MHDWIYLFAALFTGAVLFSASAATTDEEIRNIIAARQLLARALLANVVIVPILAAALLYASGYHGGFAIGAVLAAVCPGAPFGTYFAGRSRGHIALAVVLTCGLTAIALITTPVTSLLIFGSRGVVGLPRGFGLLLTLLIVFLPVLLAQALRRRSAALAKRLGNMAGILGAVALAGGSIAACGLRSEGVRSVGWKGSTLILSLVVASMGAGWLAGRSPHSRATLATSTGLRNVGLAYLFAEYSFRDPQVGLGVAAYSILMIIPNLAFAGLMRWRARVSPSPTR